MNYYTKYNIYQLTGVSATAASGDNFIPNATLEIGSKAWQLYTGGSSGTLKRVTVSDGPASNYAFENTLNEVVWALSSTWLAINHN